MLGKRGSLKALQVTPSPKMNREELFGKDYLIKQKNTDKYRNDEAKRTEFSEPIRG
jgi:hypothetical protein